MQKGCENLVHFHRIVGVGGRNAARRERAEKHDCKDRADRAKRDKAEAVFTVALVAQGVCHADAERHDKGNGNRPCRNPARVERKGQEADEGVGGDTQAQAHEREQYRVKEDEQLGQFHTEYDFDDTEHKENAHAHTDGQNQRRSVNNGRYLPCQHGKVGLGNGDEQAHQETDDKQGAKFARFG